MNKIIDFFIVWTPSHSIFIFQTKKSNPTQVVGSSFSLSGDGGRCWIKKEKWYALLENMTDNKWDVPYQSLGNQ